MSGNIATQLDSRVSARRAGQRILAFGALAFLCVGGRWLASTHWRRSPVAGPPVIILPDTLDFGEAWETDAFAWHVDLQNVSDRLCIVRGVRASCTCVAVQAPLEFCMMPGERVRVGLKIDLRKIRTSDPADPRGIRVDLMANVFPPQDRDSGLGPVPEYRWLLEGTVRRPLKCEPFEATLGEELVRGRPGRVLEFHLRAVKPGIVALRLEKTPPGWTAQLFLTRSGKCEYVLRAMPTKLRPGAFEDHFAIRPITTTGQRLSTYDIRVAGVVAEPFELIPQCLDLGAWRVGETAWGTFSLVSRKRQPMRVLGAVCEDPWTKLAAVRSTDGRWLVTVHQPVKSHGPGSCSGTVEVQAANGARMSLPFEFRWYGKDR